MKLNGPIQRKLALLDERVRQLERRFSEVSFEEFSTEWELQAIAERGLQVAVEAVIDIAERILALNGQGPAASSAEAVRACAEEGFLESADPYLPMVGFRNFIVHQYDRIDPKVTFDILKNRLDAFRHFRDEIDRLM